MKAKENKIIPDEILIKMDPSFKDEKMRELARDFFIAAKEDIKADKQEQKGKKLVYNLEYSGSGKALTRFVDKFIDNLDLGEQEIFVQGNDTDKKSFKKQMTEVLLDNYVDLKRELNDVRVLGVDNTMSEKLVKSVKMAAKFVMGVVSSFTPLSYLDRAIGLKESKNYEATSFEIDGNGKIKREVIKGGDDKPRVMRDNSLYRDAPNEERSVAKKIFNGDARDSFSKGASVRLAECIESLKKNLSGEFTDRQNFFRYGSDNGKSNWITPVNESSVMEKLKEKNRIR